MPPAKRVFWRNDTCVVWVGSNDAGELEFFGDEEAYSGTPGASYEYWITVAPDQFELLRQALGADPAADVVELVCKHVDQIMKRGERSWLDDHGIVRRFSSH